MNASNTTVWEPPADCHDKASCHRHGRCMYIQCRHSQTISSVTVGPMLTSATQGPTLTSVAQPQTTGWTARQAEQFEIGYAFYNGGFPRVAPHDESEWRWWLKGWDCAQMEAAGAKQVNAMSVSTARGLQMVEGAGEQSTDLRPYIRLNADIVECLRWGRWRAADGTYQDTYDLLGVESERLRAADEIETLRAENEELRQKLIQERGYV